MADALLVSNLLLWCVVIVLAVVVLALARQVGVLHERVAPAGVAYAHDQRWGLGNGHAHVRASMLGSSVTLPVVKGSMTLGEWQQVVLVDSDTRPRSRVVHVGVVLALELQDDPVVSNSQFSVAF